MRDWDVEPTAFSEFVTIETGTATNLLYSSDNGFETANPLGSRSEILFTGEAVDSGPSDHGALFDFGTATLVVQKPNRLLAPSAKALAGLVPGAIPTRLDHFLCYKVHSSSRFAWRG